MRLFSGKRLGQSGFELALAVFFSFTLHVLIALAATFLYLSGPPKSILPPYYQVKLVDQPMEVSPAPQAETPPAAPAAPAPVVKPKTVKAPAKSTKKAAPRHPKSASKKAAVPELSAQKPKSSVEQPKTAEPAVVQPPAAAEGPAGAPPSTSKSAEGVAVTTPQQDFKFSWYLVLVRDKIGQNWRPPPDARDAKARVVFAINRSGWVGNVDLDADHSSGTFGFKQAAIRAIRASNPFPPLPEEFSKKTLEFSVDLMAEQ